MTLEEERSGKLQQLLDEIEDVMKVMSPSEITYAVRSGRESTVDRLWCAKEHGPGCSRWLKDENKRKTRRYGGVDFGEIANA